MAILFFLILFTFGVNAQSTDPKSEPMAAYQLGDRWIVIDHYGKTILSLDKVEEVTGYSEGLILVKKASKVWAFYDLKGQQSFTVRYDDVTPFKEGRALVSNEVKDPKYPKYYGFINKGGRPLTEVNLYDATKFSEGLAYILDGQRRGYIDTLGNYVLPINYIGYEFSNGIAAISNKSYEVAYIDKEGRIVIPFVHFQPSFYKEDLLIAPLLGKYGYVNIYNQFVIDAQFDDARAFNENRAIVGEFDKDLNPIYGIINRQGDYLISFQYMKINDFSEKHATARDKESWYILGYDGLKKNDLKFNFLGSFKYGLAWATNTLENKYGFIDYDGNWIYTIQVPSKIVDLRYNIPLKLNE